MSARCRTCRFWEGNWPESDIGLCMKNPPTVFIGNTLGVFPATESDTWCGQYEMNEEQSKIFRKECLEGFR